jgi:hypothetical protein
MHEGKKIGAKESTEIERKNKNVKRNVRENFVVRFVRRKHAIYKTFKGKGGWKNHREAKGCEMTERENRERRTRVMMKEGEKGRYKKIFDTNLIREERILWNLEKV